MQRIDTDILVAGGGVAGLAATAALSAAGFDVVCVDPAPPAASSEAEDRDRRTTAFLQPSVDLLTRAGLWPRLEPHAAPLRIMRIAEAGDADRALRETADFGAEELGVDAFGYNLPNWLLRREISAHLEETPTARLMPSSRVAGLTTRLDGAIVRLADGTQVRAQLVVAADGRDSLVRELAGIGARRWSYGQKALVFTVTHAEPHGNVSIEIHRTGGPFTLAPLPDRDGAPASAVVWMDEGPRVQALLDLPVADFEAEMNARACGVLGPMRLAAPRRLWPIIAQIADRLDGPRTALVAEAAHVIPPIGAQGLNMSLADIAALAEIAGEARASGADIGASEALARYHRTRYPQILLRVAGVDALNRAAMAGAQPLRDARLAGLRTLHGVAPLRRAVMRLGLGAR